MKLGQIRPVSSDSLSFAGKCDVCLQVKEELHKHDGHWKCKSCIDTAEIGFAEDVDLETKFLKGKE